MEETKTYLYRTNSCLQFGGENLLSEVFFPIRWWGDNQKSFVLIIALIGGRGLLWNNWVPSLRRSFQVKEGEATWPDEDSFRVQL